MIRTCFILTVILAVVSGALNDSLTFLSHTENLIHEGNTLKTCLNKVVYPLYETSQFATDVVRIDSLMSRLESRISTMRSVINAVMIIPVVGQYAAVVLAPSSTVFTTIDSGLKLVTGQVHSQIAIIKSWLGSLMKVPSEMDDDVQIIEKILSAMNAAENGTIEVIACIEELPSGNIRTNMEGAVDQVIQDLDNITMAAIHPVQEVIAGCQKMEGFMDKLHLMRRRRDLPSLQSVLAVLTRIDDGMGPVGDFLDKVHVALNKKICLVGDIVEIGKTVVAKVGKFGIELVHSVGHVVSSIGDKIKDLIGRSTIDGQYYIIVDKDFDTHKRGLDVCFSIDDALKVVNGITNGILGEARKYISKIFQGHLPFHITGLTGDFFNLPNILKRFNIPFPSISGVLKLTGSAITRAIQLDPLDALHQAAPTCIAASVH